MKFFTFKLSLNEEGNLKTGNFTEALTEYIKLSKALPENAQIHNDLAVIWALNQNYVAALEAITKSVTINPTCGKALSNRGAIKHKHYCSKEDVEADLKLALSYLKDDEKTIIYFNWGVASLDWEEYTFAGEKFSQVLELDPTNSKALIELYGALAHIKSKQAISYLKQLVSTESENAHAFNYLGCAQYKAGQIKDSVASFSRALFLECKDEDIDFNLARSYYALGDFNLASIFLPKATKSTITNPRINFQIGLMHLQLEDSDSAKLVFEKVLKVRPSHEKASVKLASIYLAESPIDPFQKAEGLLSRALKANDKSFEANFNMGKLKFGQNKLADAQSYLEKALKIYSNSAAANYLIGLTLHKRCALDDAYHYLNKAVTLNENYRDAHIGLAEVSLSLCNKLEALQHFRNALAIDNRSVAALNGIGSIYLSQGCYQEAKDYFNKTLRVTFTNIEANFSLGRIQYYEGHYAQAEYYFDKVLNRTSEHFVALFYKAHCCLQLKQTSNAEYYFRQLGELDKLLQKTRDIESFKDFELMFYWPSEDTRDSVPLIAHSEGKGIMIE